jgi:hypothetical protein
LTAAAFIFEWSVYGAGGKVEPVRDSEDPMTRTYVQIKNCANITFGVVAARGQCGGQFTIFSI